MDVEITNNVTTAEIEQNVTQATINSSVVQVSINDNSIVAEVVNNPIQVQISNPVINANFQASTVTTLIIGIPGVDGEVAEEIIPLTENITLTAADSGKVYKNDTATGLIEVTLADPDSGIKNSFVNLNAFGFKLIAPADKKIRYGSIETAEGGYILSTEIGAFAEFLAVSDSLHLARSTLGTWEVN